MIVSQHNITIFIRTKDRKRLFFTNYLLRLSFNIISHFEDIESQTYLSIANHLPRIQILENIMVWEKFSNIVLFLSESTNGQQIAIQVRNQKNKVKNPILRDGNKTCTNHL